MVTTLKKIAFRKDETGNLFLDLELDVVISQQKAIMRLSIPASPDCMTETGKQVLRSEQQ